jgi:hypothetical protein
MKENPTFPRPQDSSYSSGHFTGEHKYRICGPVNVFSPSNFSTHIPCSLAIFRSTQIICFVLHIFLLA